MTLTSDTVKGSPKLQYIPVPNDATMANSVCPICQEKFEARWIDDAQDFVWMDAVKIGGRIYHASCHAEASKDGSNTPNRHSTPDPVLGKRKAEVRLMHGIDCRFTLHTDSE
jgi:pre-mRNA cleavage complex 2 protein Pcf11